jgi:D-lyxose ketol-isomerase
MLGWDVTDFGSGDFHNIGRTLFTLRNGSYRHMQYQKVYSEKLILLEEEQAAPIHYHAKKMEDIINRGGGNILVRLHQATAEGTKSTELFELVVDGCRRRISAGGIIRLPPGESICLPPGTIHQFWSEKGTGLTVSGEVSSVCDDLTDNCFLEEASRFPTIEEDELPLFLLCNEYPIPCEDEMGKRQ